MGKKIKGYYKLPIINYRIATHEGDAVRRLASQAHAILPMPIASVPNEYERQFAELKKLIEDELDRLPNDLMIPVQLGGIRNSTAVKYIKLLIAIELETNE